MGREGFPENRLQKLESIGFDFDPIQSGAYIAKKKATLRPKVEQTWNKWFNELLQYKKDHGNILVSPSTHGSLFNWMHCQRKEYKKYSEGDDKASMTEKWIKKLDKIGRSITA